MFKDERCAHSAWIYYLLIVAGFVKCCYKLESHLKDVLTNLKYMLYDLREILKFIDKP